MSSRISDIRNLDFSKKCLPPEVYLRPLWFCHLPMHPDRLRGRQPWHWRNRPNMRDLHILLIWNCGNFFTNFVLLSFSTLVESNKGRERACVPETANSQGRRERVINGSLLPERKYDRFPSLWPDPTPPSRSTREKTIDSYEFRNSLITPIIKRTQRSAQTHTTSLPKCSVNAIFHFNTRNLISRIHATSNRVQGHGGGPHVALGCVQRSNYHVLTSRSFLRFKKPFPQL